MAVDYVRLIANSHAMEPEHNPEAAPAEVAAENAPEQAAE